MMSIREKISKMLMFGFHGTTESEDSVKVFLEEISEYKLGGVILFKYNVQSPQQLLSLTNALKRASNQLLIAVDQEGGKVQRLSSTNGFFDTQSADYIAQHLNYNQAYDVYFEMAKMLKEYGINLNFAPCVDINGPIPCSVIGGLGRSYGEDPDQVIEYSRILMEAHRQNGIFTVLKHFPGHGFAQGDTHKGLVDVTNFANPSIELRPYQVLLSNASGLLVMSAHIVNYNLDPSGVPATLSKKIITGILREQLGFQGIVITDALEMGAIANNYTLHDAILLAINAGNDILMFARNSANSLDSCQASPWDITPSQIIEIIESLVLKGLIDQGRIEESYQRIQKTITNKV